QRYRQASIRKSEAEAAATQAWRGEQGAREDTRIKLAEEAGTLNRVQYEANQEQRKVIQTNAEAARKLARRKEDREVRADAEARFAEDAKGIRESMKVEKEDAQTKLANDRRYQQDLRAAIANNLTVVRAKLQNSQTQISSIEREGVNTLNKDVYNKAIAVRDAALAKVDELLQIDAAALSKLTGGGSAPRTAPTSTQDLRLSLPDKETMAITAVSALRPATTGKFANMTYKQLRDYVDSGKHPEEGETPPEDLPDAEKVLTDVLAEIRRRYK
ncbi:MAG: hypothetical protein IMZ50_04260, partial [Candidatus Atribacteria bacterium]|nr:hypothetical protein [Candidatus Atribacteria bacterium]